MSGFTDAHRVALEIAAALEPERSTVREAIFAALAEIATLREENDSRSRRLRCRDTKRCEHPDWGHR